MNIEFVCIKLMLNQLVHLWFIILYGGSSVEGCFERFVYVFLLRCVEGYFEGYFERSVELI